MIWCNITSKNVYINKIKYCFGFKVSYMHVLIYRSCDVILEVSKSALLYKCKKRKSQTNKIALDPDDFEADIQFVEDEETGRNWFREAFYSQARIICDTIYRENVNILKVPTFFLLLFHETVIVIVYY